MALINNSHKFIFIHIPKAAGTSITKALSKFNQTGDFEIRDGKIDEEVKKKLGIRKHSSALEIIEALGIETWKDYYTFSFVRHPYDRAISIYRFLKFQFKSWEGFEVMESFKNINDFIESEFFQTEGPDKIFLNQTYWLKDPDNSLVLVDFIGRFEHLDRDFYKVESKIATRHRFRNMFKKVKLKHQNKTDGGDVHFNELNEKSKSILQERYAEDFREFDYQY